MDSGIPATGYLLLVIAVVFYFLPTVVASNRKHANAMPIFLVNLFLGWTFLGWVTALVWSFSARSLSVSTTSSATTERLCPFCAESIKRAAIKCKHCGADVTATQPFESAISAEAIADDRGLVILGDHSKFLALCTLLVCIIIGAGIYHLFFNS